MILILLTLLPFTSGSVIEQKYGFIGEDVLLPCNCSNDTGELIWQNGNITVNVHSNDKINIDAFYMNRTQLFLNNEKRNCSLLLLNITLKDEGVYTCFSIVSVSSKVSKTTPLEVILRVLEKENTKDEHFRDDDKPAKAVSISIPILVVVAILAAVLLVLLFRRRHRNNIDTDLRAQEHMIEKV